MKKFLLPLFAVLLFTTCKKEITPEIVSEEISSKSLKNKKVKTDICHYDVVTGTSQTLSLNENALKTHLDHGDLLGDCSEVLTTICDQDWMAKNLDVDTYSDGTPIPEVQDPTQWTNLTTGAWCYYENNTANGPVYGKLYNWYAIAGIHDTDPNTPNKILAPTGWHVPSDAEWTQLTNCLGGEAIAGGKMKSTGTIEAGTGLWRSPNVNATNSSGFSGIPGGNRVFGTPFLYIGQFGYWWSSTEANGYDAWFRALYYNLDLVGRNYNRPKHTGHSVRLIRG